MANCTHFDRLDFAVHGILLTSVGLAGLVANVLCLLVLHRPALRVGRQVSLKCRYIGLFSTRHNCKICESLCFWHVISQLGIVKFDEISKLEIAAVSALCWLFQFCTLKKIRNRLREYSKIRQFDTYQIAFLMTCQQHKFSRLCKFYFASFFCKFCTYELVFCKCSRFCG